MDVTVALAIFYIKLTGFLFLVQMLLQVMYLSDGCWFDSWLFQSTCHISLAKIPTPSCSPVHPLEYEYVLMLDRKHLPIGSSACMNDSVSMLQSALSAQIEKKSSL